MFFKKAKRIKELECKLFVETLLKDDYMKICISRSDEVKRLNEENEKLKVKCEELSDKHWNECWQIAEYDNDLRELKEENRKLKEKIEQIEASIEKTSE